MIEVDITKNEALDLHQCTMKVNIPEICVTRYRASRQDFKWEMKEAIAEIVKEYIEKHTDDF